MGKGNIVRFKTGSDVMVDNVAAADVHYVEGVYYLDLERLY